jgi:energy-converting hydrogenase Eha subunit A
MDAPVDTRKGPRRTRQKVSIAVIPGVLLLVVALCVLVLGMFSDWAIVFANLFAVTGLVVLIMAAKRGTWVSAAT